jgi:serine/threonine-protein kinase
VAGQPQTSCPKCAARLTPDARFCGVCGAAISSTEAAAAPSATADDDLAGREIAGRYRILTRIGQGGMGAVYRAEQISLKRIVAVKLLKSELSDDPALVRRFNTEAELAARLNHPNTVTLFDFGQDHDGTLFIAMEHVEGTSLRELILRHGPVELPRALAIAEQVCASLADAHTHGIVHRDMKPDNVMLTERGRQRDIVRVLDFGIAKLRDERGDVTAMPVTQAGDLLGTPQYMAPEQIRGEQVDGRTDVYAMGAVLYEMVTGRLPFEGPTVMAILGKHLTDRPEPPSQRRPDLGLPTALDQLIMAALAKAPEQRPASMDEMVSRIAALRKQVGERPSQKVIPRRTTRPPGVPLTVDEPVAHAPTAHADSGAPLAVAPTTPAGAHYTPPAAQAPLPTPQPPPQMQMPAPQPPPTRSGPGAALWVPLGIAVLCAAGVALVLLTRDGDGGDDSAAAATDFRVDPERDIYGDGEDERPAPDPDDESIGVDDPGDPNDWGASDLPPAAPAPDLPNRPLGGTEWRHPSYGYGLVVPPGFEQQQLGDPNLSMFAGDRNGYRAYIGVSGQQVGGDIGDDILRASAEQMVASSGGVLRERRRRVYQGEARWTIIYDLDAQDTRWEVVLYGRRGLLIAVAFGVSRAVFDDTKQHREVLFERRVLLP